MRYNILKFKKLLTTALFFMLFQSAYADCTNYEMAAKSTTDRGKSISPRYIVDYTGSAGYLMKNKTGSSSWSASDGKLTTGSSLFALFTENGISAVTIYGSGTGGNRTLSKVEVGTTTSSYATVSASAATSAEDDGKFTTSGQADSMRIEVEVPANSYIAITFSGNVNITLVKLESCSTSDCSPTVAASCKADAWAPGIDYVKNAPATITWTCIATSSGGDDTKLRYKWYRYPVGHPELEEEAEGTNDEATFTPDPKNIHDWMEYYCRVTEVGCSGHDDTHATGAIRVQSLVTGWIVFEGESYDALQTSPVSYTGSPSKPGTMTYSTSSSSVVDVSAKTNNVGNGKTYSKGIQISKSTSGYLSFDIPDGYTATFTYAFAGTGNRTIMLASEKINSTSASGYIATLTSAVTGSTIQGGSYSTPLDAGTYYICEGGSGNWIICELIFNLEAADCTAPTNTSPAFGGKADYKVGDTPVLSFTASATPANGGAISYQWYQNTTGSKVGAVVADPDADGYNNRATYTPSTSTPGTHFYYCVMREDGCSKTVETDLSGIVTVAVPPTTGWIIFDGAMHNEMQASPVYYYDGSTLATSGPYLTYTTKGSISLKDISDRTNDGSYKSYTNGFQTGGTTSSSNNYLEFTIPEGTRATSFSWAFGSTGNNRTIHLGTKPASVEDDIALLCTFPASGGTKVIKSGKYTGTLEAGTYYISSLDGGACLYVDLNFTLESTCTAPTNTSAVFGGKADYNVDDTPVLSFTASATANNGGEISYLWYQNTTGSKVGAVVAAPDADGYNNRATYTPSTKEAGVHFYYCVMTEAGCPLKTETDLSGIVKVDGCYDTDIINATLTSASKANVTGLIGGTADISLGEAGSGGYKLGSNGQYFMVTLADGNFQEGDVIKFNIGKPSGTNKLYFYSSKSAAGKFAEISADAAGTYSYTLTAEDISKYNITNTIGSYRESSDNNPYMISISVERLVCYCTPPTITAQPTGTVSPICSDGTHTLAVTATGASSYQWFKDGVSQTGKTSASFGTNEAGEWYCEAYSGGSCFARSKKVAVEVKTKVTIAWDTEPADGKVAAPWTHPAVTTNYGEGLAWSSSEPTKAIVEQNADGVTWDLKYLAEGKTKIRATITGAGDYCGEVYLEKEITVSKPDCEAYSFHWGTDGQDDWSVICFEQVGSTTEWISSLITIPSPASESDANNKLKYYVGYQGYWNPTAANSTDGYFNSTMPYALSPSQSKLLSAARTGNVGGAQGYLRIYDDSGEANKYVGFIPSGYAVRLTYKDNSVEHIGLQPADPADIKEINWSSDIITLTEDMLDADAHYNVDIKTSDSYVWAEGRSALTVPVGNMRVRDVNNSWRATALAAGDAGTKGKFAIYADSGDNNWYCYFIPYVGIEFDLNGGDSWTGTAPELVAIDGNESAREVSIPAETPKRKGYKFVGWNTSASATVSSHDPEADVVLTGNLKLYAIWEEIVLLPLACDDDFTGSEIAADGAFAGTHYEGGFSANEKFYIIGDATKTSAAGGTPEQKTGSSVTINSIDFTEFIYLKGAATLDGSGIPTDRAVKFMIPDDGKLTVYYKDGKNIRLFKEGGSAVALAEGTGAGFGTYSVENGTYYIYATAGSTNIVGISFECCPSVTKYPVSEKDGKTSMCPGDNATIRLANSQTGIQYQLYKDDVLIEGSEKDGSDGNALDWAITVPGTYKVKSYDEYCPAVAMTESVTIANPGATITGDEEMMRTESIVLTADKKGGTWALVDPADAPKLGLGTPDETDGVTSKLTVTGLKEGTVKVKYSLNGCETIHTVTVNEYSICTDFSSADLKSPITLTNAGTDLQLIKLSNSTGKPDLAGTSVFSTSTPAALKTLVGKDYALGTVQRVTIKPSVSLKKIVLYAYYNSSTVRSISKVSISDTGDDKSYTEYSKGTELDWTVDRDADTKLYVITISAIGDNYIPANKYLWIEYNGTGLYTYEICYSPVDCSDLFVTSSGSSTTLNYNETVTLTASITDGAFTTTGSDKITLTDNGDGTATVKALSLMSAADVIVVYTRPNGCEFETPIHVNADPCPEPTVTLYTAKEQVLGTDQPLILSGIGATSTGTLSYKWYSNSSASTLGATEITGAAFADFITTTASSATDTYYFLRVTNTVGVNSKSVNSDFIKITTVAACAEQVLITANAVGTNKVKIEAEADGGIIGGTRLEYTHEDKRLDAATRYFMLKLAEGNFQAGDIVKINITTNNKKLYLFYENAEGKYLPTEISCTADVEQSYTLTQADIDAGVTNMIGIYRPSSKINGQDNNPQMVSMSVARPFCFADKNTCLDETVNFAVCDVAPAAGYTYEWKVNGGPVAGTKSVFAATATTEDQQIACTIIKKDGATQATAVQATAVYNITGDGTEFHFSKTTYFKGQSETLVPVTPGGTWSSSDDSKATISSDGVFTVKSTTAATVTITYTNANGCSHSETVNVSNQYFVFTGAVDDKWSTVGNWSYASSSPYKPIGLTNALPNIENRVILLDTCVVDIPNANADFVRIAKGTAGEVEGNGHLTISPNGALTIVSSLEKFEADGTNFGSGIQTTPADVKIESGPAGQGALSFNQSDKIPQATVVQYIRAYYDAENEDGEYNDAAWQYIGIPFQSGYPVNLHYFYGSWMDEWIESSGWLPVDENAQAEAFRGYALTQMDNASGAYYVNEGTLCKPEHKEQPLNYTNNTHGRNLLANSWASPIYASKMEDADFINADKVFYVFNTGSFKAWTDGLFEDDVINTGASGDVPAAGQYISIPIHSAEYTGQSTIAPMQGFFIYAKSAGASLTLDYERVVHNTGALSKQTAPLRSPSKARQEDNVAVTKIRVIGDTGADQAYILTGKDEFHNAYDDGWDGRKFTGSSIVPYLAVETSSGKMSVSAQPQLLGTTFSFRAGQDTYYDLIITTEEEGLMLKDMEMGITIPLRDTTEYSFYSQHKNFSSRFQIVKGSNIITGIDNESGSLINAAVVDGKIVVSNFTGEPLDMCIFDMAGKLLTTRQAVNDITTISVPAGVYLVRINDKTFKTIVE